MTVSDRKREQIFGLITEGENLDPVNLDLFYRWVQTSHEALGFHPSHQRRFDDCCRSSCDSIFMRIYLGVWILRLSVSSPGRARAQSM